MLKWKTGALHQSHMAETLNREKWFEKHLERNQKSLKETAKCEQEIRDLAKTLSHDNLAYYPSCTKRIIDYHEKRPLKQA